MAEVVALIDDLFFQSKLIETARHAGVSLRICGTTEALATELAAERSRLIVIDLNAKSNPIDAIRVAKSTVPSATVIAFLSHVQTELAERARAAGCNEVMPRSKFTRDLATILSRAKSQD